MSSSTVLGASRAGSATVNMGEIRMQTLPEALTFAFGLKRRVGRQQHREICTYFGAEVQLNPQVIGDLTDAGLARPSRKSTSALAGQAVGHVFTGRASRTSTNLSGSSMFKHKLNNLFSVDRQHF
jgi:hypothetical protein